MEEVIKYILEKIVSKPEEIRIEREEQADGEILFNVYLPEEDKGIVIGKGGRNIQAIRNIVGLIAKRENLRTYIKIVD